MTIDKMLCDAICDAGEQINWPTTIGNLRLWTRLGIPTKATRFKTHQTVRFFVWDSLPCWVLCWVANLRGADGFYFSWGV